MLESFSQKFEEIVAPYAKIENKDIQKSIAQTRLLLNKRITDSADVCRALRRVRDYFSGKKGPQFSELKAKIKSLSKEEKKLVKVPVDICTVPLPFLDSIESKESEQIKKCEQEAVSLAQSEVSLVMHIFDHLQQIQGSPNPETYEQYYASLEELVQNEILKIKKEGSLAGLDIEKVSEFLHQKLMEEKKSIQQFIYTHQEEYEKEIKEFCFFCYMIRKYIPEHLNQILVWETFQEQRTALRTLIRWGLAIQGDQEEIGAYKKMHPEIKDFEVSLEKEVIDLFDKLKLSLRESPLLALIVNVEKDFRMLWKKVEKRPLLDATHLVKGEVGDIPISEHHREWFLFQAIARSVMKKAPPEKQQQIALSLLQAYGRAAAPSGQAAKAVGVQTSPLIEKEEQIFYHRSNTRGRKILLEEVHNAYGEKVSFKGGSLTVVNGPLAQEVFARLNPDLGVSLELDSLEEFEKIVSALIEIAKRGKMPDGKIYVNCSKLMAGKDLSEIEDIAKKCRHILRKKLAQSDQELMKDFELDYEAQFNKIFSLLNFTVVEGQDVVLESSIPKFETMPASSFRGILSRAGCLLSQDQARLALLNIKGTPETVLRCLNVPIAELATKGEVIPIVCHSFSEFMQQPLVTKFRTLSESCAEPYLQVLPEATTRLLEGLVAFNIDKVYKDSNILDLLQFSYIRISNAMREAILRKEGLIAFHNQIDVINQEIQTILAIVRPYKEQDFSQAVSIRLTTGERPLIPENLGTMNAHLKTSGMHAMMSVVSSVEKQKGDRRLGVVVLKDSYYETAENLKEAKSHDVYLLDGDVFNERGMDRAFSRQPEQKKIDLFIGEFHHNISLERQEYRPEKILNQIKAMVERGLVADKFTVALDVTMDLEQSDEVREFLADPVIQQLIKDGKLNLVLVKSAQKFDMLGMDNYSGGFVTSLNNPQLFEAFNTRMALPEDQLGGLSYQGLTHIQRNAGVYLDGYRRAVMANTKYLYGKLPESALYTPGGTNTMQISRIEDPRIVYLDIKFPGYPLIAAAVVDKLFEMTYLEGSTLTHRASFGFATTNVLKIDPTEIRLSIGLEDKKTLDKYARFIGEIQSLLTTQKKKFRSTDQEIASIIFEKISAADMLRDEVEVRP